MLEIYLFVENSLFSNHTMQMFTLNVCFLWTWLNISHKFNDTLPLSGNLDVIPHSIVAEHETHQKDLNSWWCWNIRFVRALNWIEKWKCGYISNLASFWRHLWRCIRKYIPRIVHMVCTWLWLVVAWYKTQQEGIWAHLGHWRTRILHWKQKIINLTTLSSLVVP